VTFYLICAAAKERKKEERRGTIKEGGKGRMKV